MTIATKSGTVTPIRRTAARKPAAKATGPTGKGISAAELNRRVSAARLSQAAAVDAGSTGRNVTGDSAKGRKPRTTAKTAPKLAAKPAAVKTTTRKPVAAKPVKLVQPKPATLGKYELNNLLATGLISAAADFALAFALPAGMSRAEAVAQVGKWLSYLPSKADWDSRLGPRSDAGRRSKAS